MTRHKKNTRPTYIASFSGGKDSTAMVLYLLENSFPLDIVLFYDTGMEFKAIYAVVAKVEAMCKEKGVSFVRLYPKNPFLFDMLLRDVHTRNGETKTGYSWCGGPARWGTREKLRTIDAFQKSVPGDVRVYVGIASDEPERITKNAYPERILPLVEAHMTEQDCLRFCRDRGISWSEESPAAPGGYIDLYDILDRVSCWCCANKNKKELRAMFKYLPQYWDQLKYIQSRTDRPIKKYKNQKYGSYGNVFDMEKVFTKEVE